MKTPHGYILTPTVMPVVNPNRITISPERMKKLGATAVITNAYIIRRNSDLRRRSLEDGVHRLIGFDGPIMTDSGTFQSHVYGDVEYTNSEIVEFQRSIGSDIGTILDIFSEPTDSYLTAKNAVEETHRRFLEAGDTGDMILAGPIQGSVYPDLRRYSARIMSEAGSRYLPVGGVVPLLESYRYSDLVDIILNSRLNSDFSAPMHLFGAGHPMFLGMSVLLGIDTFDSASYVKYARDSRLIYPDGTRDLSKIDEFPMWSPLYGRYTVREMFSLDPEKRIEEIAWHNLFAIFMEISEIRERIMEQNLWQYVEGKARAHPALFNAYLRILYSSANIAPHQEISKKSSFFYFDRYSSMHPSISRLSEFIKNIIESAKKIVIVGNDLTQAQMPEESLVREIYNRTDHTFLFPWNSFLVPVELKDTYPVQQIVGHFNDQGSLRSSIEAMKDQGKEVSLLSDLADEMRESPIKRDFDLQEVRTIADYQFGMGTGMNMFPDGSEVRRSRSTNRIRSVSAGKEIIATLRPHDGFFTLSFTGGLRIRKIWGDRHSVSVNRDSAEYNVKGFNVFFKFLTDFDHDIIAGNETTVADPDGNVVAVGKATVPGRQMGYYKSGVAVKVTHGRESGGSGEDES